MYEDADYVASKRAGGSTTLKRVFFFTYPVVAYKVKIHKMFGDDVIAETTDFQRLVFGTGQVCPVSQDKARRVQVEMASSEVVVKVPKVRVSGPVFRQRQRTHGRR